MMGSLPRLFVFVRKANEVLAVGASRMPCATGVSTEGLRRGTVKILRCAQDEMGREVRMLNERCATEQKKAETLVDICAMSNEYLDLAQSMAVRIYRTLFESFEENENSDCEPPRKESLLELLGVNQACGARLHKLLCEISVRLG